MDFPLLESQGLVFNPKSAIQNPKWFCQASGDEDVDLDAYGTPATNVEAQCLRRCCSKFGISRNLWRRNQKSSPQLPPISQKVKPLKKGVITKEEWLHRFGNQKQTENQLTLVGDKS